jgi:hypothetical protein
MMAMIPIGTLRKKTDAQRDARHAGPQADGPGPLVGRERDGQDRKGAGHEQGGADALDRAEHDQLRGRRGEPAREGRDGEDGKAGQEHLLAAVAVAEDAAGQQE